MAGSPVVGVTWYGAAAGCSPRVPGRVAKSLVGDPAFVEAACAALARDLLAAVGAGGQGASFSDQS